MSLISTFRTYAIAANAVCNTIAMATITCMTILILLFRNQLVGLYWMTPQAEKLAIQLFCCHAIVAVFFLVLSFCLPNTLRAAEDVVWTMVLAGISIWVFRAICYSTGYLAADRRKRCPKECFDKVCQYII